MYTAHQVVAIILLSKLTYSLHWALESDVISDICGYCIHLQFTQIFTNLFSKTFCSDITNE